jgi:hypothetical protein
MDGEVNEVLFEINIRFVSLLLPHLYPQHLTFNGPVAIPPYWAILS